MARHNKGVTAWEAYVYKTVSLIQYTGNIQKQASQCKYYFLILCYENLHHFICRQFQL